MTASFLESKSLVARLLATENITVDQGDYRTASFDIENRVLRLPYWEITQPDVYDMMIGHEVGHALHTKMEDVLSVPEDLPQLFINIVEDVRIEKLIQRSFPGLRRRFNNGYRHLFNADFFKVKDLDVHELPFMDRVNLKAKLGDLIDIRFSFSEAIMYERIQQVETFDEVVEVVRAIVENQEQEQQSSSDKQQQSGDSESEAEGLTDGQPAGDGDEQTDTESNESDAAEGSSEENSNSAQNEHKQPPIEEGSTYDNFHESVEKNLSPDIDPTVFSKKTIYMNPASFKSLKSRIIRHEDAFKAAPFDESLKLKLLMRPVNISTFMNTAEMVSDQMARNFEMKKAAYRYSRSHTARRGTINLDKLHRYRYDDNIFNTHQKLADAKSHGMVMLVDFSGSMMGEELRCVLEQTVILSLFCRKVHIPFVVYSFTTSSSVNNVYKKHEGRQEVDVSDVCMIELVSSRLSNRTFNDAIKHLLTISQIGLHRYANSEKFGKIFSMGSTPLDAILTGMPGLLHEFKTTHGIDKLVFTVLSDGASNHVEPTIGKYGDLKVGFDRTAKKFYDSDDNHVPFVNQYVRGIGIANGSNFTMDIMDYIRKRLDFVVTHGYFIADRWHFRNICKYYNKLTNESYVRIDMKGFDAYDVMTFDVFNNEGKPVTKTKKSPSRSNDFTSIKRQFRKMSKDRNSYKKMVDNFVEIIS